MPSGHDNETAVELLKEGRKEIRPLFLSLLARRRRSRFHCCPANRILVECGPPLNRHTPTPLPLSRELPQAAASSRANSLWILLHFCVCEGSCVDSVSTVELQLSRLSCILGLAWHRVIDSLSDMHLMGNNNFVNLPRKNAVVLFC